MQSWWTSGTDKKPTAASNAKFSAPQLDEPSQIVVQHTAQEADGSQYVNMESLMVEQQPEGIKQSATATPTEPVNEPVASGDHLVVQHEVPEQAMEVVLDGQHHALDQQQQTSTDVLPANTVPMDHHVDVQQCRLMSPYQATCHSSASARARAQHTSVIKECNRLGPYESWCDAAAAAPAAEAVAVVVHVTYCPAVVQPYHQACYGEDTSVKAAVEHSPVTQAAPVCTVGTPYDTVCDLQQILPSVQQQQQQQGDVLVQCRLWQPYHLVCDAAQLVESAMPIKQLSSAPACGMPKLQQQQQLCDLDDTKGQLVQVVSWQYCRPHKLYQPVCDQSEDIMHNALDNSQQPQQLPQCTPHKVYQPVCDQSEGIMHKVLGSSQQPQQVAQCAVSTLNQQVCDAHQHLPATAEQPLDHGSHTCAPLQLQHAVCDAGDIAAQLQGTAAVPSMPTGQICLTHSLYQGVCNPAEVHDLTKHHVAVIAELQCAVVGLYEQRCTMHSIQTTLTAETATEASVQQHVARTCPTLLRLHCKCGSVRTKRQVHHPLSASSPESDEHTATWNAGTNSDPLLEVMTTGPLETSVESLDRASVSPIHADPIAGAPQQHKKPPAPLLPKPVEWAQDSAILSPGQSVLDAVIDRDEVILSKQPPSQQKNMQNAVYPPAEALVADKPAAVVDAPVKQQTSAPTAAPAADEAASLADEPMKHQKMQLTAAPDAKPVEAASADVSRVLEDGQADESHIIHQQAAASTQDTVEADVADGSEQDIMTTPLLEPDIIHQPAQQPALEYDQAINTQMQQTSRQQSSRYHHAVPYSHALKLLPGQYAGSSGKLPTLLPVVLVAAAAAAMYLMMVTVGVLVTSHMQQQQQQQQHQGELHDAGCFDLYDVEDGPQSGPQGGLAFDGSGAGMYTALPGVSHSYQQYPNAILAVLCGSVVVRWCVVVWCSKLSMPLGCPVWRLHPKYVISNQLCAAI